MNKENNSPYILWLASWYPNKLQQFEGDFIQRHAQAVSVNIPVHVLHVIRDKERVITTDFEIIETPNGILNETVIYYASISSSIMFVDKLFSFWKFNKISRKYFKKMFLQKGLPSAIHVHVAYKAGLMALWLKKKFKLDYIVTEHWTGYDRGMPDNYFSLIIQIRYLIKKILKKAKIVSPVSDDLGKKLLAIVPSLNIKTIPNVVNENIFYFENCIDKRFRFIHNVSSLKEQKNTEGLIKCFTQLNKINPDWECIMYGPASAKIIELVKETGMNNKIKFTGEISYSEVANIVKTSSAYVSFSNYENQPCSILEALCCGVPVIATNVGGLPEIVHSNNGILIEPGNEIQLVKALETMLKYGKEYNNIEIATDAIKKFSFNTVGKQLYSLYIS